MLRLARFFVTSLAVLGGLRSAHAQSFYLDVGGAKPSSTHAGMASAPGVWNGWLNSPTLVGIYGQPIAARFDFEDPFACDLGVCSIGGSDDTALLDYWINGDCFPQTRLRIQNLELGTYRVHLYFHAETACSGGPIFTLSWYFDPQSGGAFGSLPVVPWTGSFATSNHAQGIVTHGTTGNVDLGLLAMGLTGLSGIQFEKLAPAPTEFCFGTQGNCPCGPGAPNRGCPTSYDANGARLSATGESDVALDTLTLHAEGVTDSFTTIVQGANALNGGVGSPFGDGKMCVSGGLLRLKRKLGVNGALSYPEPGETAISTLGFNAPGVTRTYQVWFRDSPTFCTSGAFNLTNAVAVVWR